MSFFNFDAVIKIEKKKSYNKALEDNEENKMILQENGERVNV